MDIRSIIRKTIAENTRSTRFLGACDRIRAKGGEELWQNVMKARTPISKEEVLKHIDPSEILDDGEPFDEYLDVGGFVEFYKTGDVYFIADGYPNGVEMFWRAT